MRNSYTNTTYVASWYQREKLKNQLDRLPVDVQKGRAKSYFELWHNNGERAANLTILDINERLDKLGISLSDNDKRLEEIAEIRAEVAQKQLKSGGVCSTLRYVMNLGVDAPAGTTQDTQVKRVITVEWWSRRLRTLQMRAQETIAREFGAVNKMNNVYVSNSAVSRVEARRQRSWDILKTLDCVNEDDPEERLNMYDVAKKSIANPENRHNELMTRAAGFDAYSRRHAHVADFYTITCPSKYHAYHYHGKQNEKFEGATPRDGQKYLVEVWARIRAKLKREGIQIYGLRIAEPHHDGTPHWHMLLYVKKSNRQKLRRVIRNYALSEDNHELYSEKRKKARYTVEGIDPKRGSGASYILKYISKNIGGIPDENDFETGKKSSETAKRVSVWASVWGIRQFQQIGGGSVTIWRELRRIRELQEKAVQGDLFSLWDAADSNNWDSFILLLGGADLPRSQQLAELYKEIAPEEVRVCENTGEYFNLALNKYGEERELVLGVTGLKGVLLTHAKKWKIEKAEGVKIATLGVL